MKDDKKSSEVLFPGVSLAYLKEKDAFNIFSDEHRSRENLYYVCFKVQMDLKGRKEFLPLPYVIYMSYPFEKNTS